MHRTLAFVLSKGAQGGSLKDPPPQYQNVFYKLFNAPKHHKSTMMTYYTGCKEILLVLLKLNNSVKDYSFRNSFTPIQNRSDRIYVKCY